MRSLRKSTWIKGTVMLACSTLVAASAIAQGPPAQPTVNNSLALTLLIVIGALALAIGLLANVVMGAAQVNVDRYKQTKNDKGAAGKIITMVAICLLSTSLFAQDAATAATAAPVVQAATNYGGLDASTFYVLLSIIVLELIVLLVLVGHLKALLATPKPEVEDEAIIDLPIAKAAWWKNIWSKANSFRPIQEEHNYTLDHSYDGIQELDNSLPKWWLYGFYACIIFSVVYIYRFHVSHSGPSSEQEYITEMAKADAAKEEYLKKSANAVDENTVVLITDAAALQEGKKLFTNNCAACHGPEGGGIVGPNLTDEYWLHKGGVKDIFKTIKYGVAEKGMKSWKDDFSPVQIAQLASYIKSIHGSKPANPKEPQGEIYKDEDGKSTATADTTKLAAQ